jgi:hypothetical protein
VLPVVNAGAIFLARKSIGTFQGMMFATTPHMMVMMKKKEKEWLNKLL